MGKAEILYRQIAYELLDAGGKNEFTQIGLARKFGFSTSTVSNALMPLEGIGAVQVGRSGFRVTDAEKLLLYWASTRTLSKDVAMRLYVKAPASEIERSLPPGIVFTAYTGFRRRFGEAPADYGEVYAYAGEKEIRESVKRLSARPAEENANLVFLRHDEFLDGISSKSVAPTGVLFVDLWNLRQWYARDFVNALKRRLAKWFE